MRLSAPLPGLSPHGCKALKGPKPPPACPACAGSSAPVSPPLTAAERGAAQPAAREGGGHHESSLCPSKPRAAQPVACPVGPAEGGAVLTVAPALFHVARVGREGVSLLSSPPHLLAGAGAAASWLRANREAAVAARAVHVHGGEAGVSSHCVPSGRQPRTTSGSWTAL